MKPSNRIAELIIKNSKKYGSPERIFRAIFDYLDEQL